MRDRSLRFSGYRRRTGGIYHNGIYGWKIYGSDPSRQSFRRICQDQSADESGTVHGADPPAGGCDKRLALRIYVRRLSDRGGLRDCPPECESQRQIWTVSSAGKYGSVYDSFRFFPVLCSRQHRDLQYFLFFRHRAGRADRTVSDHWDDRKAGKENGPPWGHAAVYRGDSRRPVAWRRGSVYCSAGGWEVWHFFDGIAGGGPAGVFGGTAFHRQAGFHCRKGFSHTSLEK